MQPRWVFVHGRWAGAPAQDGGWGRQEGPLKDGRRAPKMAFAAEGHLEESHARRQLWVR